MACLPAVATTALFIAVILLDLMSKEWRRIPGRALFGIFAVLLVQFICDKGDDWVAWTLLAFPFVLLFIGYIFRVSYNDPSSSAESEPASDDSSCGCPCCGGRPCHCMRPCWMPRWRPCPSPPSPPPTPKPCPRPCPKPKPCPGPGPGPKPDDCIPNSLAD